MNKIQIARAQFPQYAAIADDTAFSALPDVAAFMATLPAAPAPTGTTHTIADAVKAFASVSLTNGQGAEGCPLALYSFVKDATGMPKLIGGTWAEVNGTLTISKDKYDAPGESYHGREKSVKFVVAHNQTNAEYRISGGALQAAFKAAGRAESFDNLELKQEITESNGYSKAVVTLA